MAEIIGINHATLYRQLDEAGVKYWCTYTEVSDTDLDAVVRIKANHPNDGECLVNGHLTRHGVDPENTAVRRSIAIRRRVYHVEGPDSLRTQP